MTTKTTTKNPEARQREAGPLKQEMEVAYQVHALASILYSHLIATHPWVNPMMASWPQVDPTAYPHPMAFTPGWPGAGYPIRWNL